MNFPFFMLMVGPSQTGKTTWIFNFIKHFSFINHGHTLRNVFLHMAEFDNSTEFVGAENVEFYSIKSSMKEDELKIDAEIIKAVEDFKRKTESMKKSKKEHDMIVMDDMMMAVGTRKKMMQYVEELVTRKCHHENINYIFVVQDLMFSSSKFRVLFSNANYIVLFPNKSDSRNAKHILRSRGYNGKEITQILKEAFDADENSHPYLLLDSTVKVVENLRIRQGIFPGENLYVYDKIDECLICINHCTQLNIIFN